MKPIIAIVVFVFFIGTAIAGWREGIDRSTSDPIAHPPTITVTEDERGYTIVIVNESDAKLHFYGRGKDAPSLFFERFLKGRWDDSDWDWCGTGQRRYTFRKSQVITLRVEKTLMQPGTRLYVVFYEGPTNGSLIKVIEREAEPNQALQTTSVTRSGFGKVSVSDRQRRGV